MGSILAIDDEPDMLRFIQRGLSGEGHVVTVATTGEDGVRLARRDRPQVVLLDLMMPRMDGRRVLRELATGASRSRVVVLSGVSEVTSRVECLDCGAADYLVKPFAMAELRARVRAQLRTLDSGPPLGEVSVGRLTLDTLRRSVSLDGREVALTTREYQLVAHLMSHAGAVCTRAELLKEVWGYSFDPGTNVVDACVRRLRSKLTAEAIDTIRNVGYTVGCA